MDRPNPDGGGGGGSSGNGDVQKRDFGYAENMRKRISDIQQEMIRERKALEKLGKPYEAQAREQVTAAMGGPGESIWMTIAGISKKGLINQGTSLVSSLAGVNGRSLETSQVEAVAEHIQSGARTTAAIQLSMDAVIIAAVIPRWNRIPQQMRRGPFTRFSWPFMLMIGYAIPAKLFVEPLALTLNARYRAGRFIEDPRMSSLNVDIQSQLTKLTRIGWDAGADTSTSSGITSEQPEGSWEQSTSTTPSWDTGTQSKVQSQTPSDAWGTSDDIDDASPIASSSRTSQEGDSGGSAWDRIRRQSMPPGQRQQQQQQQQRPYRPPPPPSSEWGSADDAVSDSQRPRESNAYSQTEYDKSPSKDQAQREFDRLLEQERKGLDQENNRWRRS